MEKRPRFLFHCPTDTASIHLFQVALKADVEVSTPSYPPFLDGDFP